jgi:hypothetical protein
VFFIIYAVNFLFGFAVLAPQARYFFSAVKRKKLKQNRHKKEIAYLTKTQFLILTFNPP